MCIYDTYLCILFHSTLLRHFCRNMYGGLLLALITPFWGAPQCNGSAFVECVFEAAATELAAVSLQPHRIEGYLELATAAQEANKDELSLKLLHKAELELQDSATSAATLALRADLAKVLVKAGNCKGAMKHVHLARSLAHQIEDETQRWDLRAKLNVIQARTGAFDLAVAQVLTMPEDNNSVAAFKARALHDIAPWQARKVGVDEAIATLAKITMGLTYYRAAASTDVAVIAHENGEAAKAKALLEQAYDIAVRQDDGYFQAGALRHIADAYAVLGDASQASTMYAQALAAARNADQPQQRARAISRIATSMSDRGLFVQATRQLPQAMQLARLEPEGAMRWWAFYEIAGSAAFAGDFDTANHLLSEIPADAAFGTVPLRAVVMRDISWGLARHQHFEQAFQSAIHIQSRRERIQALSRVVRAFVKPKMAALPRYL